MNNIAWIQYRNTELKPMSEKDWHDFLVECSRNYYAKTGIQPEIVNVNRVSFPASLAERMAANGAEILHDIPAWASRELWLGRRVEAE